MPDPIACLYFDERGMGPDPSELRLYIFGAKTMPGGASDRMDRNLGLLIKKSGIDLGGFMIERAQVQALRDQLSAWLDAAPVYAEPPNYPPPVTR